MEAASWLACTAFVTAFFAGCCLCMQVVRFARSVGHSVLSLRGQGDEASRRAGRTRLLRNGVPFLVPLAERLLRMERMDGLAELLVRGCRLHGWDATKTGLLSILGLGSAALFAAGCAFGSAPLGIALAIIFVFAMVVAAKRAIETAHDRLRDGIPGVLRSMNACFHAGYTLLQTFRQIATETDDEIAGYFDRAASGLETGKTTHRVLEEVRRDADKPELGFVIVALEVQHRTGGSMRQIIDSACDAVNQELALRRSLRVQTAQARLSAQVVTIMPFVLIALLSTFTQDFLAPFFSSASGIAVLTVALAMQAAGVAAVRKLLEVRDE